MKQVLWIAAATVWTAVVLLLLVLFALRSALAADLSGTPRRSPGTPGALEAIGPATTTPSTVPTVWRVAQYRTYLTRPLFDGAKYETCLASFDKSVCTKYPHWKKIGVVPNGTPCEDKEIRALTNVHEYHYTTISGKRGLAVCRL